MTILRIHLHLQYCLELGQGYQVASTLASTFPHGKFLSCKLLEQNKAFHVCKEKESAKQVKAEKLMKMFDHLNPSEQGKNTGEEKIISL